MRFPVKPGMTTELEEDFVELLSDSDEFSPTFELFFEVDEPSPQATKNNASKEGISNFMTGRFLE
jgi:hypothetical protein